MTINIIHLPKRIDRCLILQKELESQNILDFKIWTGIIDAINPIRGISRAHKQIVQNAKELKLPYTLIAEDDVKFTSKGAFDFFLKNIPADYDLYLCGVLYGKLQSDNSVTDFSGTMPYLIHKRFYETFLSIPEIYHIDRGLKNKGKFIVCNPMVAIQHDGYSDNSKRIMKYNAYLQRKNLYKRE